MSSAIVDNCFRHKSDMCQIRVERYNVKTGAWEPATGITTLTALYSATAEGAAIHSSLSKPMTERSDARGIYYAVMLGSDKVAQLTAGATIYRRFVDTTNGIDDVRTLLVQESSFI